MRFLVRTFCILLILVLLTAAVQAVYFLLVLRMQKDHGPSDAVIVFRG